MDWEALKAEAITLAQLMKDYEHEGLLASRQLEQHKVAMPPADGLSEYAAETRRLNDIITVARDKGKEVRDRLEDVRRYISSQPKE